MRNNRIYPSMMSWAIAAIVGFLVAYYLNAVSDTTSGAIVYLSITLFPVVSILSMKTPIYPWLCPVITYSMIPFGIYADAITDTGIDRNLWGIEILFLMVLSLPFILTAWFIGLRLRNNKQAKTKAQPVAGVDAQKNARPHS